MKNIELLAPAGNKESFVAAINAGADAIYLAGKSFGARKYASNFTNEEIKELIIYAHKRNVRVFVTINTIIFEEELTELFTYSDFLVTSNVDALIVQDIGIINEFVKRYPSTEIHASTQMNTYTVSQLEYLKKIGVKRAILARETSLDQIKTLSKVGLDLEIFIHGALCVSYSGNCYFSYFKGGRSGNRGECAQPCRLEYSLIKDGRNTKEKTHLLSTKDLKTIEEIDSVINSGVVSLKIEGRMRRVEYVASTVRAYKEAINHSLDNQPFDLEKRLTELLVSFNREYTKGYVLSEEPSHINNDYRPNHLGIEVGRVISYNNKAKIKLSGTLKVNDGIRIIGNNDTGGKVSRILLNNEKVQSANNNQIIELDLKEKVEVFDKVHKTLDYELNQSLQPYLSENFKVVPLSINLHLFVSNKIVVEAKTPFSEINFYEDFIIEKAKQNPQTKDQILKAFNTFGNSYFDIVNIEVFSNFEGFIPNSVLKRVRRKLIELLEEKAITKQSIINNPKKDFKTYQSNSEFIVKVETTEQYKIAKELGIKNIYYTKNVLIDKADDTSYLYLTRIHNDDEIKESNVVVHDIGLVDKYPDKNIVASAYFNVTNSLAIENINATRITLSNELTLKQIKDLRKADYPLEYVVYQRPDMMISKYCPITKSEGVYKQNCNLCQKHTYKLEDKSNQKYPILRDYECNVRVLHHRLIKQDSLIKDLVSMNISIRVNLTTESKEQTRNVIEKYLHLYNQNKKA